MFKIIKNWLKRRTTAKQARLIIKKKKALQELEVHRRYGLKIDKKPSPIVTFGQGTATSLNLDEIAKIFSSFLFRPIDISKISKDKSSFLCFWYGAYFISFDYMEGGLKYTYGYSFAPSENATIISGYVFTLYIQYACAEAFYKGTEIYFKSLRNLKEEFDLWAPLCQYPQPVTLQKVFDDLEYIKKIRHSI